MKTTKRKVAKRQPAPAELAAPAPPVAFTEVWSHSPNDHDESLQMGNDGTFRVLKGGDVQPLTDPARVVEYVLQCCLDKSHWSRFAAFMPTLYPPSSEDALNVRVEFKGAAAAAVRTVAGVRGIGVERAITECVANDAACWLADSNTQETPAYAVIFGLEEEAA